MLQTYFESIYIETCCEVAARGRTATSTVVRGLQESVNMTQSILAYSENNQPGSR